MRDTTPVLREKELVMRDLIAIELFIAVPVLLGVLV